jgi:hypothetical protein
VLQTALCLILIRTSPGKGAGRGISLTDSSLSKKSAFIKYFSVKIVKTPNFTSLLTSPGFYCHDAIRGYPFQGCLSVNMVWSFPDLFFLSDEF